jgi:pseudouridylate synthase
MLEKYLDILPEIKEAISNGCPVVALESTIISHGMPYPKNIESAKKCEALIRENGAIPATIGIIGGRIKIGLTDENLEYLGTTKGIIKTSRDRKSVV